MTSLPFGHELIETAFDHAPCAIVVTQKRRILTCNDAFCELFGYAKGELIGLFMLKLYPSFADFKSIGDRGYKAMLRNPENYSDERFMQARDGEVFWARAAGRSLTPESPFDLVVWTVEKIDVRPAGGATLSQREREISSYIANGQTCKEIARQLGISHRTVEVHRARIMKKLGCRNTAEMVSRIIHRV
ncbi:LuxR C-terminal-related transcriptional regulator [Halomonas beimenensis]|uniref:DNA-binding response regulator, NarL/FixJ family, contains REC and HTH domains n=1 Tax=Halomonas beimenensis TaxID=475662 RepID=A0A291P8Q6_9GAMM|nr:LuxR C-terminal-related transcriptional regulator [Halomonas beimenensis]ATJ83270.1 DNA-binding response regulator, NarL/FixJ family, contains REC and HTH domains [Halomonas beimenensis]